jgi:predicted RecA/RadA family phage recombinase
MRNSVQRGDILDLDAGVAVTAGQGFLFGDSLFGIAIIDAKHSVKSAFAINGVAQIAKAPALAIARGDRLYWDAVNRWVNKTAGGSQVGIATEDAAASAATVAMLLELVPAPVSGGGTHLPSRPATSGPFSLTRSDRFSARR